jgi:hypothetical protein
VGKLEGKRPFGRTRCRWEDGIGIDLVGVGCGGVLSGFSGLRLGTCGGHS